MDDLYASSSESGGWGVPLGELSLIINISIPVPRKKRRHKKKKLTIRYVSTSFSPPSPSTAA